MAMNAALEGVKRVLKEEKKEGNSAAAIRNCQVGIAYCTDLQQNTVYRYICVTCRPFTSVYLSSCRR